MNGQYKIILFLCIFIVMSCGKTNNDSQQSWNMISMNDGMSCENCATIQYSGKYLYFSFFQKSINHCEINFQIELDKKINESIRQNYTIINNLTNCTLLEKNDTFEISFENNFIYITPVYYNNSKLGQLIFKRSN